MRWKALVVSALCGCLLTLSCQKKSDDSSHEPPAQDNASQQEDASTNKNQRQATGDRLDFSARTVKTADGVETITAWEDDTAAFTATWTTCQVNDTLARLGKAQRSPIRRMIAHGEHLYVVTEYGNNETEMQAFITNFNNDGCQLAPWQDFAQNSMLVLGQGVADVDIIDDTIVAVGVQTRLFDLQGNAIEGCDDLRGLTRARGQHGQAGGVARKSGDELFALSIQDDLCELSSIATIDGDEQLGMDLVTTGQNALFATLQYERVPNAFAYIQDGKIQWRYFPGDEDYNERITGISSMTRVGNAALLVRSIAKTIDVITPNKQRTLHLTLKMDPEIDTLVFPRLAEAIDEHRILVTFVEQESADKITKIHLRMLTLVDK